MAVEEQHRAEAVVRQSIARHRALLAMSRGGIVGPVITGTAVVFATHTLLAAWPSAVFLLLVVLFMLRERRVLRRLQSGLAVVNAAPPKTHAEAAPVRLASVSTADMADGFARLGAVLGPCAHKDAEPVDLLVTGERVAWTCPECPAKLPADWR
jgi:hypothetical protein